MTEKINKKVSDVSENKLAKDENLKRLLYKLWKNLKKLLRCWQNDYII